MLKILDVEQLGLPYIDLPESQGTNKPVMEEVKIPSQNINAASPDSIGDGSPSTNAAYRPAPQITGNLQVDPEISLPSPGMDVEIAYFYNSNSTYNGPYGYGRTINTNLLMSASGSPMLVTFQRGNGAIENYQETGVGTNVFEPLTPTLPNSLEKDTTNNLWKETTPDGRTMAYPLDISGQIVSISYVQDSAGNCHTFSYSSGLLTTLEDAVGRKVSFTYDGNGYLETIQDWADRFTTFQYGTVAAQTVLTTVIGPSGCQTGYDYDNAPLLTGITDPNGHTTTYSYDANGLVQQRTYMFEGVAQTTQYSYGAAYTQITDPLGAITTLTRYYYWDLGASTDPLGHTVSFTNNAQGQQTMRTDPLGNIWTTVYDSTGILPVATIDPLGNCTTIQRDTYNNPTTMIYADGTIATMLWGDDDATRAQRRLQATVDPLGNRSSFSYNTRGQLTEAVNPLGQCVTHSYDEWGNRISSTNMLGQVTTMAYDLAGNVIATVDPLGHTTSISYDAQNRPIEVTTPLGNIYTTAYDSVGNPVVQIDPLGRRTSISYNVFDHPADVQDMQGNRVTFGYDAVGRTTARINALGFCITTTYDAAGRMAAVQDALGFLSTIVHDDAGRVIANMDALGNIVTNTYDSAGRNIAITDPIGYVTSTVYDNMDRPIAIIDALGHITSAIYDLDGRIMASIDPLGYISSTVYDAASRPVAIINASGQTTSVLYDPLGRISATVDSLGYSTSIVYDAASRLIATIDARGFAVSNTYDADSRLISVQNARGYVSSFVYDAAGERIAMQYALGYLTTVVYDDLGRQQNAIDPLGYKSTFIYDAASRLIAAMDANGNSSSMVYDGNGWQIAAINALGYRTSMVYDAVGQRIAVVDGRGNSTSSVYDARGSLITTIDPLNRLTSYAYDAVANQTLRVDARGIATSYSYDPRNLLAGVQYPDGSLITNSYDALGQLTVMADDTGITSYSYDADNRQSTVAYPVGKVLSYSYDGVGNRTKLRQGGNTTDYNYDPNNNLTQIANPYNETTTFSYDALDREEQKTLANGVTIDFTYDAAGRKVLLEQRKADATALAVYTATYDAVGIQTSTLELDGSVNDYSYDATYQLLNETRSGTNAFSTTFTYDATGNRLIQDADGTLTTSTYDAANQLLIATTNSDVTTFTYDANGNQTVENANGALTTYTWDAENRMIGADDGTITDSFIYAGNGQRRKKSTSTEDINYLWDGQNVLEELDDSDSLIAHYTGFPGYWGGLVSLALPGSTPAPAPATAGMGAFNAVQFNQALFNQSSSGVATESHFYLFDLQTNNRLLLDATSATDNEYLYKAFGEKVLSTGTIRNPFQFQGQAGPYFDADNRTQMGARIVDPTVGRWFSPDPIRFAGGDANLYRFVFNNPVGYVDPSGLDVGWALRNPPTPYGSRELDEYHPPLPGRWNNAAPSGGGASQKWPLCPQNFNIGNINPDWWNAVKNQYTLPPQAYPYWWDIRTYNTLPSELNPFNPNGSLRNTLDSIYEGGMALLTWNTARGARAYNYGIFGQTEHSDPVTYYGTRISVGVATVAVTTAGTAGLFDPGAASVLFYNGAGAGAAASESTGVTLADTIGGNVLNRINSAITLPYITWVVPSAFYALQARGPVTAFLGSPAGGWIWFVIEKPILTLRGIEIIERFVP